MKITWIGHSCFKIEKDGYSIIVDPYKADSVPGLLPVAERADMVLCSHEHGDHNGREEVYLTDVGKEQSPFQIETIQTYHDEVQGAKRGNNQIFVISDGRQKIAHFGDLGCELTSAQLEKLQDLDAALVPVGGYYTIDGKQAAKLMASLQPKIIIPMHYKDDQAGFGFAEIDTVDTFTAQMHSVTTIAVSELDTDDQQEAQVVVMPPVRRQNK